MDHDKRIDNSVPFAAVNIAVLTVSDSRSLDDDRSGDVLVGRVADDGHNLVDRGGGHPEVLGLSRLYLRCIGKECLTFHS